MIAVQAVGLSLAIQIYRILSPNLLASVHLMSAVNERFRWQLSELLHKGILHVLRGALEKPPCSADKKRISSENSLVAALRRVVAHVTHRMSGSRRDAGGQRWARGCLLLSCEQWIDS